MTDEEIKIEATKIAMKESCHRCDKVLCDYPSKYCKWFNGCYKLAKENAELNRDKTELVNSVTELTNKVTELEGQKENIELAINESEEIIAELKEELRQKSDTNHSLVEQLADKQIIISELKEQVEEVKCKNIYAVPDELLNSVPCYTVYDCKHCSKRS